jgi:lysophospholipase L1-like esterase
MSAPRGLRAKLLLSLGSLGACAVALLAAEGLCRLLSDVPFQGSSRNLFVARAWGATKGNTPNVEAFSFGNPVFTDRHGFRVPRGYDPGAQAGAPALLLLGDSVAFGSGVDEPETLAGRLRGSLPEAVIYNSSVVGYGTYDYKAVVEHFLPAHPEVRAVILVFCLNDVAADSARDIDAELAADAPHGLIGTAKELPVIRQLNEGLRSRSKLFLVLKVALTDPQRRYWLADASRYAGDAQQVARNITPIGEIAANLGRLGIPFAVIVAPYEFQLREQAADVDTPQRRLAEHLAAMGVEFVDALPAFRAIGARSDAFFLRGDPMHFSPLGHEVVQRLILDQLARWGWSSGSDRGPAGQSRLSPNSLSTSSPSAIAPATRDVPAAPMRISSNGVKGSASRARLTSRHTTRPAWRTECR